MGRRTKKMVAVEGNSLVAQSPRSPFVCAGCLALLILSVAMIVLLTHWPALGTKALSFDDGQYLTDNVRVQNPSWTNTWLFLAEVLEPATVRGYYQPLAMISLMTDTAMGGSVRNLMPYHRTSLILHVANTCLVILLIYVLFGQLWVAGVVGLLFGVHPMTVEAIPWVGERKTLLAAFFSLWCLIFHVRYTRSLSWKSYLVCLAAYLLALMSKPTSTMLPVVMLLMDFWPLHRLGWRAVKEKIPFLVICVVSAVVTVISQGRTAKVVMPEEFPAWRAPLIFCHNVVFYLWKMIWPANLTSHYEFPQPLGLSNPMVLTGVIGTIVLIVALVVSLRRTRAFLTGWLIFIVAIFPTFGIIGFTNVIASDKYAYLPVVGLLMALAWVLVRLSTRSRAALPVIVLAMVPPAALATRHYYGFWKDSVTLFEYMARHAPRSADVQNHLGVVLAQENRIAEAEAQLRRVADMHPKFPDVHVDLGKVLIQQKKFEEAIEHYRQALELAPNNVAACNGLGAAYGSLGKFDLAAEQLRRALQLKPRDLNSHFNLGILLFRLRKYDEAVLEFRRVLELNPADGKAHAALGHTLSSQGKLTDAVGEYETAHRLEGDNIKILNELGVTLARLGRIDEAAERFQRACDLAPNDLESRMNLAKARASQKRIEEAIEQYNRVLEIAPGHPLATRHLNALQKMKDGG